MIKIVDGDLLQSNLPLIAHQTNCLGVMGAGGDWDEVVYPMLQELFANDTTMTLYIYKLCNN